MRVLLVEDNIILGEAVHDHVAAAYHAVDWMKTLEDARIALRTVTYGLILLDLRLPDGGSAVSDPALSERIANLVARLAWPQRSGVKKGA